MDKLNVNVTAPIYPIWEKYNNCYAYALGIDENGVFNPGFKADIPFNGKNNEEIISCVEKDFEALGFDYCEISPNEVINPDESKIAIFSVPTQDGKGIEDFHFVKQDKTGVWSSKEGYDYPPMFLNGFDPITSKIPYYCDGYSTNYKYIKTYKIKKG